MTYDYQTLNGTLVVEQCPTMTCTAMSVLTVAHRERALRTHESLYCSVGHLWRFTGKTQEQKRYEAQIEQERNLRIQAERLRLEAEQRAGRAEEERLKAEREKNATKRVLRNAVKTSAKLVSSKGRDRARSHKKRKGSS